MPQYWARALYDYVPSPGEDELELRKGDMVEVTSTEDSDWWRGQVGGREGDFPATYVEVVEGGDLSLEPSASVFHSNHHLSYGDEEPPPPEDAMPVPPVPSELVPIPPEDLEEDPRPSPSLRLNLPPDWEAAEDESGETYYWNTKTNETCWTAPGVKGAPPPPKRPEGVRSDVTPRRPSVEPSTLSSSQGAREKNPLYNGRNVKAKTPEVAPEAAPEENVPKLKSMRAALAAAEAERAALADEADVLRKQRVNAEALPAEIISVVENSAKAQQRLAQLEAAATEAEQRKAAAERAAGEATATRAREEAHAREAAAAWRRNEEAALVAQREATAAAAAAKGVVPAVPDAATLDLIAKVVNERIKVEFEQRDSVIHGVRVAMERLRHEFMSQQELLTARAEKRNRAQRAVSQAPRSSRSENSAMSKMDSYADRGSRLRLPKVRTRTQPKTADAQSEKGTERKKYVPRSIADGEPAFDENLPRVANLVSNGDKARRAQETKVVRTLAAQAAVRYAKCKSTVFAPDGAERAPADAPSTNLWLEHVHGYAGEPPRKGAFGGRNAVWLKDGSQAVFPAAALVVVHDPPSNAQHFFTGHTAAGEAVTAITRHPSQNVFASGQAGRRPKVCIWNYDHNRDNGRDICQALADLQLPQGSRYVCALRFSPCGHLLLSMCADETHTFTLWDWQRAAPLISQRAGNATVFGVDFHPSLYSITSPVGPTHEHFRVSALAANDAQYALATCGTRNVKFWTVTVVARPSAANTHGTHGLPQSLATTSPRNKRGSGSSYTPPTQWKVEGNAAPLGRQPELQHVTFTAMATVIDTKEDSQPQIPLGRYVICTDRGAITVWQQLEDDAFPQDTQVDVVEPESPRPMMLMRWLARGKCVAIHGTAHDGPILDVAVASQSSLRNARVSRVATAGRDGKIKLWLLAMTFGTNPVRDGALQQVGELLVAAQAPLLGAPRSLCWDKAETKLLLGTQGNALAVVDAPPPSQTVIVEADGIDPVKAYLVAFSESAREAQAAYSTLGLQIFHHGHVGRVNQLATHPQLPVMASVGNDRTLRLWDNTDRRLAQLLRLPDRATAVAFHPAGTWLALGTESGDLLLATCKSQQGPSARGWAVVQRRRCATKVKSQKAVESNIKVVLSNAADGHGDEGNNAGVAIPKEQEKRLSVTDLKFSPDGANLVASCMDKHIYVFAADTGYKRRLVLKGHSSTPNHLDFSEDGRTLQSNDAAREVLFWDVTTGKQITNAFSLRNQSWATWTCPLGWPVQGIFDTETEAHSHDINAVARSNKADVIITPGANNALRLLKFPSMRGCVSKNYGCHRDQISSLVFHADDTKCLSVGGKDATIALWAHFT